MTKCRRGIIAAILTLVLLASFSIPVAAQTVVNQEQAVAAQDAGLEENSGDIQIIQGEVASMEETPDADSEIQDNAVAKKKNPNTPYFVGAFIAVIGLAGVMVYCNVKGNK